MTPAYLIGTSPKSSVVISTLPPVFGSQLAFAFFTSCSGVSVVQTWIVVPVKSSAGDADGSIDVLAEGAPELGAADGALAAGLR